MSFSSVSFYVFMFAVFFIYWGIPHKFRYILVAIANLIFYLSFGARFLPVLLAEIIIAYFGARVLEKNKNKGSCCGAAETNLTRNHEVVSLIPGLTQWVKDPAWLWLWLWHRPAAVALIGPLAWEPPYAMDVALKKGQKKKREREREKQ